MLTDLVFLMPTGTSARGQSGSENPYEFGFDLVDMGNGTFAKSYVFRPAAPPEETPASAPVTAESAGDKPPESAPQ